MVKIGSLWTHKDKNGKTFFSGNLELTSLPFEKEAVNVFIFSNKYYKKGTKQPNVYMFIPDKEADATDAEEEKIVEKGINKAEEGNGVTEDNPFA